MEPTLIVKLFALLEATAGHPEGRPLAEAAAEAGLPKPTAHRILKQLVGLGYMERAGAGVYRQTALVRRLGSDAAERRLAEAAAKPMRDLWLETGETVNLGILRHGRVHYLAVLESPQPLRRAVTPGMTDPFSSTSLGRAIAAHLPDERLDHLLRTTPLEKRTPNTLVDPALIRQELARTRQRGYAAEEDETDLGVLCLAAPVVEGSSVAAAISLSAPTARGTPDARRRWTEGVRLCAARVGEALAGGDG